MIVSIDCDVLLYRSGNACQKSRYKTTVDGTTYYGKNKTELKKALFHAGIESKGCKVKKEVNPSPLNHCLHTVKLQMNEIIKVTGATDVRAILSGERNYRKDRAQFLPYKGSRLLPAEREELIKQGKWKYYLEHEKFSAEARPYHYHNIKKYLIEQWDAEVIDNMEADDYLAINQTKFGEDHIIATIDKDIRQVPGNFYNFVKKELDEVTPIEAEMNLAAQMLTGDMTDTIYGIKGVGDITARKILEGVPEDALEEVVIKEYEAWFKRIKDDPKYKPKPWDKYLVEMYTPEEYMYEVKDLVRLLRTEEELIDMEFIIDALPEKTPTESKKKTKPFKSSKS